MNIIRTAIARNLPGAPTLLTRIPTKDRPMTMTENERISAVYGRDPPTDKDRVNYRKERTRDMKVARDRHGAGRTLTGHALEARKRLGMAPDDPNPSLESDSLKMKAAREAEVAK